MPRPYNLLWPAVDDGYETEKVEASLVRLEWAQNVGRLVLESQSNGGMLDDLQEHARKLLATSTSTTCVYSQISTALYYRVTCNMFGYIYYHEFHKTNFFKCYQIFHLP